MATLKSKSNSIELPDGDYIQSVAEELGVPFGCQAGVCGTCITTVSEGMENLAEPDDEEKAFGLAENERLICQCKIKQGSVTLDVP